MSEATPRDIAPEMQSLYDDMDALAEIVNEFVIRHVGERRGFTIMVHGVGPGQATLAVSNLADMDDWHKAVADWLKNSGGKDE